MRWRRIAAATAHPPAAMQRLLPSTRMILALAVTAMSAGYFLPLWEIHLWAPQYPEGLNMKIWLDRLSGDYEIISGLNHYIGMKHIEPGMFPEFGYMGYVLGFLCALGLVPVMTGNRRSLLVFVAVLMTAGALGLYDFYRWGHDYGHNLDPKAAISVPGMTYDPPLVGYKNLLNFVAYSGPERGGWMLIAAGALATALLAREILRARKAPLKQGGTAAMPLLAAVLFLPGCDNGPVAIEYGRDECAVCKMILVDSRYGTEFITGKGKVHKFDDVNCLVEFMARDDAPAGRGLVIDFKRVNHFLDVDQAVYLKHPGLRTPMGSGIACFVDKDAALAVDSELGGGGTLIGWEDVKRETNEPCTCAD